MSWRNLSIVLALSCIYLAWPRAETPAAPAVDHAAECARVGSVASGPVPRHDDPAITEAHDDSVPLWGARVPAWAAWLAPQPGEDLLAYRDRMLPLALAAIAPQRARVARSRDDLAALAHLDARQLAALDGAAQDTANAIDARVMRSLLAGDLSPSTFKPMTGVTLARDVLDAIARGDERFRASLSDEQRATLAEHPFDFADYLAFSTRWEDYLRAATN